ncbi:NAD-dependent epimerase/dehydratase [Geobacter metallireducens RCH3]|uniref:GDP-L-fucose synthase n=1 Tax=Geobacter metallireducens (strain ATCC 53774 / DSM 7210 / GS-15) TaxID=269799 RepID=Q39W26_GEOMG|nr:MULTISPECIES: GDP-L-fucose synthase [Geobacter]ABB31548.1 GDP-L-fucose synthase [Geobacter metallireducens GS-15]EHP83809.1 NAD-dependent epimerase/dehydratase [Geobacter metallireducens RCH3]MBT1075506.1 GDP-L-fucose synthase [Geobacter grbiciae]
MNKDSRIFVAGSHGLVGSALVRQLRSRGYVNLLLPEKRELDLAHQQAVADFFASQKPDYVFLAAAKVGGIHANNTYPADFIYTNLMIQNNVIHHAWLNGVKRLLFLGSSCIYPKHAPQPMQEEHLLTGPLEPTNEPYAIAKIAGIKMCESYNRQYGTKFVAVMPTNLYGPGDNFHPENSHVLPALIRRFHEAKRQNASSVVVWGSGTPRRELLYVDDMAEGCLHVMDLTDDQLASELLSYPKPCFVNLGTGHDVTIRELAETVRNVVGFSGDLVFDASKPDGTPRKLQDISRMHGLGWRHRVELEEGIRRTYQWYVENYAK